MTSSWALSKRKEMGEIWNINNFGDTTSSLGGWEDHYIINGAVRECRSGFTAIPMGNPYGFMICKKQKYPVPKDSYYDPKKYPNGISPDIPMNPIDPSVYNGYNKYMSDLYRPWRTTQIQITNPYNYYDRTTPNEQFLHRYDYLARGIQYNSTGIKPIHTPGPRRYNEYGFSYTSDPPYKYDVTQLHQKYPIYKDDKIYHGVGQKTMDELDVNYTDSVPASTW